VAGDAVGIMFSSPAAAGAAVDAGAGLAVKGPNKGGDREDVDSDWGWGFVAASGAAAVAAAAAGAAAAGAAAAAAANQGPVNWARHVMGCHVNQSTRVSRVAGDDSKCGGRSGRYHIHSPAAAAAGAAADAGAGSADGSGASGARPSSAELSSAVFSTAFLR